GEELPPALAQTRIRQRVPLAVANEIAVFDEAVEVGEAEPGLHAQVPLQRWGVDEVPVALSPQPVHQPQDLATPIQRLERLGFGRVTVHRQLCGGWVELVYI